MKSFLIIGLGRFGAHLCRNLSKLDNEIMILDKEEEKLQDILKEEKDVSVDVVLKIVQQYKTKQGIMNALMKKYPSADNKKSSKIYKTIKPLLSDKKGS